MKKDSINTHMIPNTKNAPWLYIMCNTKLGLFFIHINTLSLYFIMRRLLGLTQGKCA